MTRRRWIADGAKSGEAWLSGDHAYHLAKVLRSQPGQEFDIIADGRAYRGKITEISAERVVFALGSEIHQHNLPTIDLVLSIYKFDRMEWAIEKSVELGVASVTPLISARTDTHLAKAAEKRAERWARIAREATQQSRRSGVPQVKGPARFKDLAGVAGNKIVLAETECDQQLADVLRHSASLDSSTPVALAIGPEGGWTEDELRWFEHAGWASASLGPTILRAETAAIAAVAIAFSSLARLSN